MCLVAFTILFLNIEKTFCLVKPFYTTDHIFISKHCSQLNNTATIVILRNMSYYVGMHNNLF